MSKPKSAWTCTECGGTSSKWQGRCADCGAWNTVQETRLAPAVTGHRYAGWSEASAGAVDLAEAHAEAPPRTLCGLGELDRVLGGGLVPGSVVLLGGDPGIGKSTLLLQALATLGARQRVLYVTGEESAQQVALRARRLGLGGASIRLAAETQLDRILALIAQEQPQAVVVDSVQTVYDGTLQSAPGAVVQVRECAAQLTRCAKTSGIALFLVGHVTKDGALAGPRVLEHMVDAVLYFEGEPGSSFRMVRAFKNRFGPVNEMGVFAMGQHGLEEVSNPSSLFLTAHEQPVSGSCVLAAMEGNRPFLVEVQALVEDAVSPNPRRYASGFELNRLQLLLAVLNKHAGLLALTQNVYVKAVGGVRLTEPAADLAGLLALHSSLSGQPLPPKMVAFGEVGLAGEIRPVADAAARLREAAKLGYRSAMLPARSQVNPAVPGIRVIEVSRVDQVAARLREERTPA